MPKKRSRDTATDEPPPEEPAAAEPSLQSHHHHPLHSSTPPSSQATSSAPSPPPPYHTHRHRAVRDGDLLRSSICGVLRYEPPPRNRLWIDGETKRYIPITGDHVIGIIESKHAEEYRLNIGGPAIASLPLLAFDGATRRNRPHLDVGALVYAHHLGAPRHGSRVLVRRATRRERQGLGDARVGLWRAPRRLALSMPAAAVPPINGEWRRRWWSKRCQHAAARARCPRRARAL